MTRLVLGFDPGEIELAAVEHVARLLHRATASQVSPDVDTGGDADLAVRPMDAPAAPPDRRRLAAVLRRGDRTDALVFAARFVDRARDGVEAAGELWACLPPGTRVLCARPLHAAQVACVRPDLVATASSDPRVGRGLGRLDDGEADMLIAPADALMWAGHEARIAYRCAPPWVGAAGQGAIGLYAASDDAAARAIAALLDDRRSRIEVLAEQAVAEAWGDTAPIGVSARMDGARLRLVARALRGEGELRVERTGEGTQDGALRLAAILVRTLRERAGEGAA